MKTKIIKRLCDGVEIIDLIGIVVMVGGIFGMYKAIKYDSITTLQTSHKIMITDKTENVNKPFAEYTFTYYRTNNSSTTDRVWLLPKNFGKTGDMIVFSNNTMTAIESN